MSFLRGSTLSLGLDQWACDVIKDYHIAGKFASIKFGEMAKNGYKLILAGFKFDDLYCRMT